MIENVILINLLLYPYNIRKLKKKKKNQESIKFNVNLRLG